MCRMSLRLLLALRLCCGESKNVQDGVQSHPPEGRFSGRYGLTRRRQGLAIRLLYSGMRAPQPPRPNVGFFGSLKSSSPVSSMKIRSERIGSCSTSVMSYREPRNRAVRDVEAFADVAHRLARIAALDRFRLLVWGELRLAPNLHSPRFRPLSAFSRARTD